MNDGRDGRPRFLPPDGGGRPEEGPASLDGVPPRGPSQGPYSAPGGPDPWAYGLGSAPPRKSRRGLITGLVIAGAVIVLGSVSALVDATHDDGATAASRRRPPAQADSRVPHTIVPPKSFGRYQRMTGSATDRIERQMRARLNRASAAFAQAKIAIYDRRDDSSAPVVFIGLSASDGPAAAAQLRAGSPSEEIDWMFVDLGLPDPKDEPAGPLGGLLRCAAGTSSQGPAAGCVWSDSATLGLLVRSGDGGVASLAAAALALRNAAEH